MADRHFIPFYRGHQKQKQKTNRGKKNRTKQMTERYFIPFYRGRASPIGWDKSHPLDPVEAVSYTSIHFKMINNVLG